MVDSPLITKSKEFALQIMLEDYYRCLDSGLK